MKKELSQRVRRQYIRLDSVCPVTFQLLSLDDKRWLSDKLQGFTNNIGKGGISLAVNNLKSEFAKLIKEKKAKLSLEIELPLRKTTVNALAAVVWVEEEASGLGKYLIGLSYDEIDSAANNQLMRYAWTKRLFLPVTLNIILILGVGFAFNNYLNVKLVRDNKALVGQLVKILQDSQIAKQQIKQISKDKEDLQLKIQALEARIQGIEEEKTFLQDKVKLEKSKTDKKIEELNALIGNLTQEKLSAQEKLIHLQRQENNVTEEFLQLTERKAVLTQANFDEMYKWLVVHQNSRTGLVMSFEGDAEVANWAFIYDQSLVAQAYIYFADFERARRLLDFFEKKAKRSQGLFYNAYYANDGGPAEYIIHSGPNIWLGLSLLHYTQRSQDNRYLKLAEELAQAIISLQNEDREGGIRGGPSPAINWYATEHNLDAYAFFNMLYKITAKGIYREAANKVLRWLVNNTYSRGDLPISRGKGDSTIATDTYAWSIAAIGPKKLEELGMSVDSIMEFAEKTCSVEVVYERPEGQSIRVKGFDFAPQKHLPRGGVISSEWTAQMILAFRIIADFYRQKDMLAKATSYELKANEYLAELSKMIISSPSHSGQGKGCLPYASEDFVDTGHGWITPKGKNTGSVAGTAYALFAYYKYNPLE